MKQIFNNYKLIVNNLKSNILYKNYSTKRFLSVKLDEELKNNLQDEKIKPRHHPGIHKSNCTSLPSRIIDSIIKITNDTPIKPLLEESHKLDRYLRCRHAPAEDYEATTKKLDIEKQIESVMGFSNVKTDDTEKRMRLKSIIDYKVQKIFKQRIYSWMSINYDSRKCLQYLLGRSPQEYVILLRILSEIATRDSSFKPRSFFDFGSGVGTGIWAASKLWKESIYEYFLVDASRDMNDLSELLLRDGDMNKEMFIKNVFYRQFLPASNVQYNLVISSYSLFELASRKDRLNTILNLWNRCDGYLVFIEHGTNAGFNLINEAREILLHLQENDNSSVHIFSPCSHSVTCPRYVLNDGTPCNFEAKYFPLPFGRTRETRNELYSYVVIKKGVEIGESWPRVVRPALVRSKHTICRLCTSKGDLQEIIFTKSKHGKYEYRCAKVSKWGDRLPINIYYNENVENNEQE